LAAGGNDDQFMPQIGHDSHLAIDIGAYSTASRRVEFVDVDDSHGSVLELVRRAGNQLPLPIGPNPPRPRRYCARISVTVTPGPTLITAMPSLGRVRPSFTLLGKPAPSTQKSNLFLPSRLWVKSRA